MSRMSRFHLPKERQYAFFDACRRFPVVVSAANRMKITLCGSTRFRSAFEEWDARLTMEGHLVYSVGVWYHESSKVITPAQKAMLDFVHLEKISASDEIFVIDVGGYVGDSTEKEIEFARKQGKKVRFLSEESPNWKEADSSSSKGIPSDHPTARSQVPQLQSRSSGILPSN